MKHIRALDGVRALAVGIVLLAHSSYGWLDGGFIGVDLFFVLSGFLITSLLIEEHAGTDRIRFGLFYLRRAYRLLPALVAALFVALICRQLAPATTPSWPWLNCAIAALFYFANFVRRDLGNLSHTWSLSIEEQFYMIWPLLLSVFLRFRNPRFRIRGFIVTAVIGCCILRAALKRFGPDLDLYALTPVRIDGLMCGAFAAFAGESAKMRNCIRTLCQYRFPEIVVAVFFLIAVFAKHQGAWLYFGGFTLIAVVFCFFVLCVGRLDRSTFLGRAFESPFMVWLGRRSYGVYLYHWPIFLAMERLRVPGSLANLVLVTALRFGVSLLVAELSYRFLEAPFLKRKGRLHAPEKPDAIGSPVADVSPSERSN